MLPPPSMEDLRKVLVRCHKVVTKAEKLSPAAAFAAFSKVLFVKLREDRRAVSRFCRSWLSSTGHSVEDLYAELRREVSWLTDETLGLTPATVQQLVELLEEHDLAGVDEDLAGRCFELFLSATLRGEVLGQYFTPRSITRLVLGLANLRTGDRVIDACCGTGGFLIEATGAKVVGIDAGKSPALAAIARMNLHLHGIDYQVHESDALENLPEGQFDVALTNPPFSLEYSARDPRERAVLENFELFRECGKPSLRSAILFLEQYWKLLEPGGRLWIIVDDGILAGDRYRYVREFLRSRYVVRAIISLPGDAFRRAGARVKTSILSLVRRREADIQEEIFVYETRFVGLDDVLPRTRPTVVALARANAREEVQNVVSAFRDFEQGDTSHSIPPSDVADRLDVKSARPWRVSELSATWLDAGAATVFLADVVDPILVRASLLPEVLYHYGRVTYAGVMERGEARLGHEVSSLVYTVQPGDLVVSNINAVHRAVAVVPEHLADVLVTSEFTVLRLKAGVLVDVFYLWCILRSAAIVADQLSRSTGGGRHRTDWARLSTQQIPLLPLERQREVGNCHRDILNHEKGIEEAQRRAKAALECLDLDGPMAEDRLLKAKPPR